MLSLKETFDMLKLKVLRIEFLRELIFSLWDAYKAYTPIFLQIDTWLTVYQKNVVYDLLHKCGLKKTHPVYITLHLGQHHVVDSYDFTKSAYDNQQDFFA